MATSYTSGKANAMVTSTWRWFLTILFHSPPVYRAGFSTCCNQDVSNSIIIPPYIQSFVVTK